MCLIFTSARRGRGGGVCIVKGHSLFERVAFSFLNHGMLDSCQCFGQIASCSVYGEAVFISFCPKPFVGCTFLIKLPPLHMWSAPVEKMSDVNKVMRAVTGDSQSGVRRGADPLH